MKLAANLSWLYRSLPEPERFAAAADDGFAGVEILMPYAQSPDWYASRLKASALELVLINTPVLEGAGRVGVAALPGHEDAFRSSFERARDVAIATGCPRIHVMAGVLDDLSPGAGAAAGAGAGAVQGSTPGSSTEPPPIVDPAKRDALRRNLDHALARTASEGIVLTLEALNRADVPGYAYHRPVQVIHILREFLEPRLRLQFDFYHAAKEDLDICAELPSCVPWIGHVQIAGREGRHEPDLGQDRLRAGLTKLHESGYTDWLGCEYAPRTTAAEGLGWAASLREAGIVE